MLQTSSSAHVYDRGRKQCCKLRVLLMYMTEGVSSVANFITAYEESQ